MNIDQGPLAGRTVLDLTRVLSGPFASQILGDLGARVIKVERPGRPDVSRQIPPMMGTESAYYAAVNRNKECVSLDYRTAEGLDTLLALAAKADVLLHNFQSGVAEDAGFGYDAVHAVNPRLIYCHLVGYGDEAGYGDRKAYDITTQAFTGMISISGSADDPPSKIAIPVGDSAGSLFAVIAILASLLQGPDAEQPPIQVALTDSLLALLNNLGGLSLATNANPPRVGATHYQASPYGVYRAADGEVAIAGLGDKWWQKLCEALGDPEGAADERFATSEARARNRESVDSHIESLIVEMPAEQVEDLLAEAGLAVARVNTVPEALQSDYAQARQLVRSPDDAMPTDEPVRFVDLPIRVAGRSPGPRRAPRSQGDDTEAVLMDILDMDPEQIRSLRASGAIDGPSIDRPRTSPR